MTAPEGVRRVETSGGLVVVLETARDGDGEELFGLFAGIVARGEGFPQAPPLSQSAFDAAWGSGVTAVAIARLGPPAPSAGLVGAYSLKPNFPGRAGHIANAGYMVDVPWRGRGAGRALVEDSRVEARRLGFDAMQFNLVFESNPARRLYEELGFVVTGRVPDALEGEDALVYWREL
ncbi:MAG: GNAT family N-acetyltransferase [Acidobacteriota bacterium]|nr:GNAT family N-acetyltransferase [Acidobacteriota bacterium]